MPVTTNMGTAPAPLPSPTKDAGCGRLLTILRSTLTVVVSALTISFVACEDKMNSDTLGLSIFGVDTANNLIRFGSMSPGNVTLSSAITGLQAGETILGIDFRPADNLLYALGSTSRVYVLDTLSAAATFVGFSALGPFSPLLNGAAFGFDFNPTVDRIRVLSDVEQNLRLNPINGNVAATDTLLAYTASDANFGANPNIVAAAYTNSVVGATTTILYAIDANRDALVILRAPNSGQMITLGPLGIIDANNFTGFDIAGRTGVAFVTFTASGKSTLYILNLNTSTTTLVGDVGNGSPLHSIAVAP